MVRLTGAGASLGTILSDLTTQEITAKATVGRIGDFGERQDVAEFEATRLQQQGRVLAARRAKVVGPSFLDAALSFTSKGFQYGGFDGVFGKGDVIEEGST